MAKKAAATPAVAPLLTCTPKRLPQDLWIPAADQATVINPLNQPPVGRLAQLLGTTPTRLEVAILTTKKWHTVGVHLTVGFLDNPPLALRKRILQHMNAWAKTANVAFKESSTDPQVRIARAGGQDGGYWSYLGTDVLSIAPDLPTLNLEGFTMQTPESEFHRVVRHETGHTLGFPHEHMRQELVALIDPKKAIAYFQATQGWSAAEVKAQVLTPLEVSSLVGTVPPDPHSIMCYQIPGSLTKDGQPIIGGLDIDATDYAFAAKMYPKKASSLTALRTTQKLLAWRAKAPADQQVIPDTSQYPVVYLTAARDVYIIFTLDTLADWQTSVENPVPTPHHLGGRQVQLFGKYLELLATARTWTLTLENTLSTATAYEGSVALVQADSVAQATTELATLVYTCPVKGTLPPAVAPNKSSVLKQATVSSYDGTIRAFQAA